MALYPLSCSIRVDFLHNASCFSGTRHEDSASIIPTKTIAGVIVPDAPSDLSATRQLESTSPPGLF